VKKSIRALLVFALALALTTGLALTAEAKNATRLTVSPRTLTMDWGSSTTLSVTTSPGNASDRTQIEWSKADPNDLISIIPTSDPRKVTVTARAGGGAYPSGWITVTAKSTVTGKSSTTKIYIKKVNLKKIDVTPSSKTVYLTPSAPTYQMAAPKFVPATVSDKTVTWQSSNENVAVVNPATGLVTFKGEGKAKIYATSATGGKKDACTFTVKPVRVKSVSIRKGGSPATVAYVDEGETFTLTAALTSASGSRRPSYEGVTWQSSNSSVIEAGASGGFDRTFTCKGSGIATITATADTGKYKKTASCTVYVRDKNPTPVTITAVGDCVLGGDPRTSGITARSSQYAYRALVKKNGYQYPFEKVSALFANTGATGYANLGIANIEVCLTSKGGSNPSTSRKFLFRGDGENAQALQVGIDIANIANNHTADFGTTSYANTATNINKYGGGALPSGYNRYNTKALPAVTVKDVGGKKIGFYGVQANQVPVSTLVSRVRKYKRDYDLDMMVVTIHWTGQREYVRPVTATMKSYARNAINAGADLVIGHHRHEISGIEKYKGKYILYDLGNFVTGGGGGQWTYAVQIDFKISSSFTETASKNDVDQIRIYPVCTTSDPMRTWNSKKKKYEKQSNNWQPVPAEDAIDYIDKDTGASVPDTAVSDEVIDIINKYSPTGADGGRFVAEKGKNVFSYSTLK